MIAEESSLVVATEQMFQAVFNIDARTRCEAIAISPKNNTVDLRALATGAVENFAHLGLEVTLIEKLNQVMPPLDPEMARPVERYLVKHGAHLELNHGVAGFRQTADGSLEVLTAAGKALPADVVMLAIGVRPETALAKAAGLEIGQRGGMLARSHRAEG